MSTDVTRQYENKVFPKGHFRQFSLKLAKFCNISLSDGFVILNRKEQDFDSSTQATLDEIEDICEIDATIKRLGFHYDHNIIQLSFNSYSNALNVLYVVNGDVEYAKRLIFFVENSLEIARLREQVVSKLTDAHRQYTPGISSAKESEVSKVSLALVQPEMDLEPNNIFDSNASTNPLLIVWHKALMQLQLLCSAVTYQTWIAPIVPSVDGNYLILNCPTEFTKDWIESRYKKDIMEAVQSIEPSVDGIIVRFGGKDTKLSNETTNKRLFIEIDEPLYDLMMNVYERETKASVGWTFERYFKEVMQSHCQGHIDKRAKMVKSLLDILPPDTSSQQAREERLTNHEFNTKNEIMDFIEGVDDEGLEKLCKFISENYEVVVTEQDREAIKKGMKEIEEGKFRFI